jgi:ATP-dependent DNA helicase RecQ/bloom syndrome protein
MSSSQPRGHAYRRNGVDSDDDSYRVDDYYAGLYDEWADGGHQEFASDEEEHNHDEHHIDDHDNEEQDDEQDQEDSREYHAGGDDLGSGDGLDESGDGLDESGYGESGYGVDPDDDTARVLFGTSAREEYDDLHDVDVPAEHQRVIISALAHHGIATPRDFQIEAIYHLGFNLRPVTIVISKTGSGKTAIPLTVGRLRRGVSLFMVPLIGLGCDLVEKFNNYHHDVEAYHLDEHRNSADVEALLLRLSGLTLSRTVYLFVSPQTLSSSSKWWKPLMKLSKGGLMALICIDEAHEVAQQGRFFRPEFVEAVKCLNVLFDASSRPLPRIIMSATMQNSDVDFLLSEMKTDRANPNVRIFWQKMNRRSISIDVLFSGNPTLTVGSSLNRYYSSNHDSKSIVYTNSKKSAEESLVPMGQALLNKLCPDCHCLGFTGDSGLMEKVYLMRLFSTSLSDCEEQNIPRLLILMATTAANCGVGSSECHRVYHVGIPTTMYNLVQAMGRCDRDGSLAPGENRFEIHLSYKLFLSLYVRIMQCPDESERNIQIEHLIKVLNILVTPNECQHVLIERYFDDGNRSISEYHPCAMFCSYCTNSVFRSVGKLKKEALYSFLVGQFIGKTPTPTSLMKVFREKADCIFDKGSIPKSGKGWQALGLQLLALGIVRFDISELGQARVGTELLATNHVIVTLGRDTMGGGHVLYDSEVWNWGGFHFV